MSGRWWTMVLLWAGCVAPAMGQQPISDLDREKFYTACAPLALFVLVIDDDENPIGLTEDRVRTMVESRLRAARLYTSNPGTSAELLVTVSVFRTAFAPVVALLKRLRDEFTGLSNLYPTSYYSTRIGFHGGDPGFIMQDLSEQVDAEIGEYLRVNEGQLPVRGEHERESTGADQAGRPPRRDPVDVGPLGPPHLAPPRCCQHQELERQLDGQRYRRCPRRPDGRRHLAMGQGPHVLHDVMLWTQDWANPVARVVDPKLHRYGPFQHRMEALAQLPGGGRLLVPDGSEDPQHVGARDLRHRHLPDPREGIPLEGPDPVAAVRPTSPPGPLLLDHTSSGFGERGYATGAPLLGQRVAARAGELAVGQRLLAGLGQRDQGDAPESELALAAPNDEPLNPAPRSRRLHVEVQPVAVRVSSRRGGAHESGRQGLVGMTALGLGFPGRAGRVRYRIPSPYNISNGLPGSLLRLVHAVADAALVEDVGRLGRVVAELVAEVLDDGAQAIGVAGVQPAPHLAQQGVRGHHPSCVEG